jgi:hypothetical protein
LVRGSEEGKGFQTFWLLTWALGFYSLSLPSSIPWLLFEGILVLAPSPLLRPYLDRRQATLGIWCVGAIGPLGNITYMPCSQLPDPWCSTRVVWSSIAAGMSIVVFKLVDTLDLLIYIYTHNTHTCSMIWKVILNICYAWISKVLLLYKTLSRP